MTIYAATSNAHKIREFERILAAKSLTVLPASAMQNIPPIPEDGDSFEANAIHKAVTVAALIGKRVFADDSGLEVNALNGEPGVLSARYGGENASDKDRAKKVLSRLDSCIDRTARFVCVIAVATPTGLVGTARGEVRGHIAMTPAGENGFGYDPIFIPDGYRETFGQLSSAVKDQLSHRGNALEAAIRGNLFD